MVWAYAYFSRGAESLDHLGSICLKVLRNRQRGYAILYFHLKFMKVPVPSHPCQLEIVSLSKRSHSSTCAAVLLWGSWFEMFLFFSHLCFMLWVSPPCYFVFHKYWHLVFSGVFFQVKILILLLISSLTHGLFRSILFSFQILESSPEIFLLLVSNLIELWSENLLCITYIMFIFFHLWTLVLWARIWSLLVNALCALDNNDYSVIIGQSSTNTNQIELVDSVVQVFYVLNDFLSVPSVIDKGVLKFLTIITDLSIFPCNSHFFFMCSRVLSLSMYI